MNEQYLTISESATLIGKSEATIRRLISQKNNPLINQMTKREGSGTKAKILIKRSFLEEKFLGSKPTANENSSTQPADSVIEILREQLAIKDSQIAALSSQVSALIQSKEHSDILLKNMQEALLALPQPQPQEAEPEPQRRTFWSRIFGN